MSKEIIKVESLRCGFHSQLGGADVSAGVKIGEDCRIENEVGIWGAKRPRVKEFTGGLWAKRGEARLRIVDAVFHAVNGTFDEDGLDVVDNSVEQSRSEGGIVIKDTDPMFVSLVGGDEGGGAFIASGDALEEQIGSGLIDRQIPKFIQKC